MPPNTARLFLWIVGGTYAVLALSFAPRTTPYFRPWERLLDPDGDRFVPSATITMPTCGDLSYKLHRRDRQHWRSTTFTTDPAGLRNPPRPVTPRVVIVGDSFVAGANLDDRETLSAVLERRLEEPVYNYASQFPARELRRLLVDPRFRDPPPRVVAIAIAARALMSSAGADQPTWRLPELPHLRSAAAALTKAVERTRRNSRLAEWAGYQLGALRGSISAHPHREVRWGEETALCLSPREQSRLVVGAAEKAEWIAAAMRAATDAFGARGTTFVFVPIPEPAAVYPELFTPRDLGEGEPLLEACVEAARRVGVSTVDLLPHLRANRTPYLFALDDSHWSPRTVELAADLVAAEVKPLLAR